MNTPEPTAITPATAASIEAAAEHLRAGRLVAFPTETVYGLGADATNGRAVAAIFAVKCRPRLNPLIVHVADVEEAERFASLTPLARRLAEVFWPGPLTIVARRRPNSRLADLVTAGLDTVAVRVPDHLVARALLLASGNPLAAPSANRSGHVSPTRAEHVAADLGHRVAMILDGGSAVHGLESTVVDATGSELYVLRPGFLTAESIETAVGPRVRRVFATSSRPLSPGQLARHYAPKAGLRLDAREVRPGEALLAFSAPEPPTSGPRVNLSPRGDLVEAAANLFAALRSLDQTGAERIAVMPIPDTGLGEAINDRLKRAAAR